jgi:putative ABC transport system substrate-binding protein
MGSRSRLLSRWLLGLAAVTPVAARVVDAQRTARILVVQGPSTPASLELLDGFRRRLGQLGRRVDVVVEAEAGTSAVTETGPGRSADLVLALGARATTLAGSAHQGVPIIGALLAREGTLPDGGWVTAVVLEFGPQVELEWMHRILPNARRVGVLYSTDENADCVTRAREVARALGMEIVARRVAGPAEIPSVLAALAGSADVLWGIPDEVVLTPETARAMLLASLRNRVPFVGLSSPRVRAGAVYALDRDYADLGSQTADLAVRLLDGNPPQSLGTVRPRKVRYALNARSADLMHLTLSADVLRGATEVVR